MKGPDELKSRISPKVLLGISAAGAVIIVGLLVYFLRASDPASRAPIPYKKFDYGAHMQQQTPPLNRQPPLPPGSSQPSGPPGTSASIH